MIRKGNCKLVKNLLQIFLRLLVGLWVLALSCWKYSLKDSEDVVRHWSKKIISKVFMVLETQIEIYTEGCHVIRCDDDDKLSCWAYTYIRLYVYVDAEVQSGRFLNMIQAHNTQKKTNLFSTLIWWRWVFDNCIESYISTLSPKKTTYQNSFPWIFCERKKMFD